MPKQFAIKSIEAFEALDSRSNPTVVVKIFLAGGAESLSSVPSGASRGAYEAVELRDGGERYRGKGVLKAVRNVEKIIAPRLKGIDARQQKKIDEIMIKLDGTKVKSRLGANAILGVSMAAARAASKAAGMPLYKYLRTALGIKSSGFKMPTPMFNVLNGGVHADSGLDVQEFMVVPYRISRFAERARVGSEIFHALKDLLKSSGFPISTGDEGGFAPRLKKNSDAIAILAKAIKIAGFQPSEVGIALDIAAGEFYDRKSETYNMKLAGKKYSAAKLMGLYKEWIKKYPIISIEDPLWEDDFPSWAVLTKEFGAHSAGIMGAVMVAGDDLFATNEDRLMEGIKNRAANAVIIKPNQIGTITEAARTATLARTHGYKLIVSHRSGDTTDDFIADLSVALGAEFIKSGAPSRGERIAKYNRLIEIEKELT